MGTINGLTLKALLLDTITYLKFGSHLHANYKQAKNALCISAGQKTNISASQLLNLIGLVYKDNKLESEFWATIDKYKAEKYL